MQHKSCIITETSSRYQRTKELIKDFESLAASRFPKSPDKERIFDALTVMLDIHSDQKDRPDGQPYVNHPLEVALQVLGEYKITDPDLVIAALLHDSFEDQEAKLATLCLPGKGSNWDGSYELLEEKLSERFGRRAVKLIKQLTNPDFNGITDQQKRNRLYLNHFKNLFLDKDPSASLIKIADFSRNALQLDLIEQGPKKAKLLKKYCPVIKFLLKHLESMTDSTHPLFESRYLICGKLRTALERDCRGVEE